MNRLFRKKCFFISNTVSFLFLLALWINESILNIRYDSLVLTYIYYAIVLFLPLTILVYTLSVYLYSRLKKNKTSYNIRIGLITSLIYILFLVLYIYWGLVQDYAL
jgi:hypothetical protein